MCLVLLLSLWSGCGFVCWLGLGVDLWLGFVYLLGVGVGFVWVHWDCCRFGLVVGCGLFVWVIAGLCCFLLVGFRWLGWVCGCIVWLGWVYLFRVWAGGVCLVFLCWVFCLFVVFEVFLLLFCPCIRLLLWVEFCGFGFGLGWRFWGGCMLSFAMWVGLDVFVVVWVGFAVFSGLGLFRLTHCWVSDAVFYVLFVLVLLVFGWGFLYLFSSFSLVVVWVYLFGVCCVVCFGFGVFVSGYVF